MFLIARLERWFLWWSEKIAALGIEDKEVVLCGFIWFYLPQTVIKDFTFLTDYLTFKGWGITVGIIVRTAIILDLAQTGSRSLLLCGTTGAGGTPALRFWVWVWEEAVLAVVWVVALGFSCGEGESSSCCILLVLFFIGPVIFNPGIIYHILIVIKYSKYTYNYVKKVKYLQQINAT